jgi:hypothetical protein
MVISLNMTTTGQKMHSYEKDNITLFPKGRQSISDYEKKPNYNKPYFKWVDGL